MAGENEMWGWGKQANLRYNKPPKWWERQVMRFSRWIRERWSNLRDRA
jgi:hypothetical protein